MSDISLFIVAASELKKTALMCKVRVKLFR